LPYCVVLSFWNQLPFVRKWWGENVGHLNTNTEIESEEFPLTDVERAAKMMPQEFAAAVIAGEFEPDILLKRPRINPMTYYTQEQRDKIIYQTKKQFGYA